MEMFCAEFVVRPAERIAWGCCLAELSTEVGWLQSSHIIHSGPCDHPQGFLALSNDWFAIHPGARLLLWVLVIYQSEVIV